MSLPFQPAQWPRRINKLWDSLLAISDWGWLAHGGRRRKAVRRQLARLRWRPEVENLETRLVPAVVTVPQSYYLLQGQSSLSIDAAHGVLAGDVNPGGGQITARLDQQAMHGTVVLGSDGAGDFTYTPQSGYSGSDAFTYDAIDSLGNVTPGQATVNVVTMPVVVQNQAVNTDLLHAVTGTFSATDIYGTSLTFSIATQPSSGMVAISGNQFTYTPNPGTIAVPTGQTAAVTFTWTASDGQGHVSAAATTTVMITNLLVPPLAQDTHVTTTVNTPVTINVLSHDSSQDGGTLTVTRKSASAQQGAVVINSNNTITYTPPTGFAGVDSFTYTITDSGGGTAVASVSVLVDPGNGGLAAANVSAVVPSQTPQAIAVLSQDHDTRGAALRVTAVGTPQNGTVSINADGTITYTSATGFTGTNTFSYTVADQTGDTATGTVTVLVTPQIQWSSSVIGFSSQAGADAGAAFQSAGSPASLAYGNGARGWAPDPNATGGQWIELGIAHPEQASSAYVFENGANGLVNEIDLEDSSGQWHTVWTGTDSTPAGSAGIFGVTFAQTAYAVAGIDIHVSSHLVNGGGIGGGGIGIGSGTGTKQWIANNVTGSTTSSAPVTLNIGYNDAWGTPNSYTLVSAPAYGAVTFSVSGKLATLTFNPNGQFGWLTAGSSTVVTFAFQGTDNSGNPSYVASGSITVTKPASMTVYDVSLKTDDVTAVSNSFSPANSSWTYYVTALSNAGAAPGATMTVNGDQFTFNPNGAYASLVQSSNYVVTFQYHATDSAGDTSNTATVTITITSPAPTVSDVTVHTYEPGQVSGTMQGTDPSNSPLTYYIVTDNKDHGEGLITQNGNAFTYQALPGDFPNLPSGASTEVDFPYYVINGQGLASSDGTIHVLVKNPTPAENDLDYYTDASHAVHGTFSGDDPFSESLTYSVGNLPDPSLGTVTVSGNNFTFTPGSAFHTLSFTNPVTFTYTATYYDSGDNYHDTSASGTVYIYNAAPDVYDVSISAHYGTPVVGQFDGWDPQGETLTYAVNGVESPGGSNFGSITVSGSQFTFTPGTYFNQQGVTGSFQYTATDTSSFTSDPATVHITVNGTLSAANFSVDTGENMPVPVDVLADNSSPDGGTLQVVATGGGSNGQLTLNPDQSVTYTPHTGFVGQDSFTYTIKDSVSQQQATGTVTVNVLAPAGVSADSLSADPQRALMVPVAEAQVDVAQGAVQFSSPLDFDQSPGTSVGGDPALVYNSLTVADPIVRAVVSVNGSDSAPTMLTAELTFNGVQQPPVTYWVQANSTPTSYQLAVPVTTGVSSSGRYNWSLAVTTDWDASGTQYSNTQTLQGESDVVARGGTGTAQDPYGAGWWIAGLDQLVPSSGGSVLWVTGSGQSRTFMAGQGGTFVSPPEDFGTLVTAGGNYIYTAKDQTTEMFSSAGLLMYVQDTHGLQRSYTYDSAGRLIQVNAPDGGVTTLNYNSATGVLSQITEPGGRAISLTSFQAISNPPSPALLTALVDADGSTRTFSYNTGNLLTEDSWAPYATGVQYDSAGLVTAVIPAPVQAGANSAWTVSPALAQGLGNPAAPVWIDGSVNLAFTAALNDSTYVVDARDREIQLTEPAVVVAGVLANPVTTWSRDAAGDVTAEVDPVNAWGLTPTTLYTYDAFGDVLQKIDPDGNVTEYSYDPVFHFVTLIQQEVSGTLFDTTSNIYNQSGDLISTTDPDGNTTTYQWSGSLMVAMTDPAGWTTYYGYDPTTLRQVSISTSDGTATKSYDVAGNVSQSWDNLGNLTLTIYNGRNELVSQRNPMGDIVNHAYDAAGLETGTQDGMGYWNVTTYGPLGLAVFEIDGVGSPQTRTRSWDYDFRGRLTDEVDGNGSKTNYTNDADGRRTATADPLNNITGTSYDLAGNVIATTDARSFATAMIYDPAGNIVGETDADGRTTQYQYDDAGRRTLVIDNAGDQTGTIYDADGNDYTAVDADNYGDQTRYDSDGRVILSIDANGNPTTNTYYPDGLLKSTTDGNGKTTQYQYDSDGREILKTDPMGFTTQTYYDKDGRVTQVVLQISGTTTRTTSTAYDADGNAVQTIDGNNHASSASYNAFGQAVTRTDALGHVVTMWYDGDGNLYRTQDLQGVTGTLYDADGRVSATSNQLGWTSRQVYDADGNVIVSYDNNGNPIWTSYDRAGLEVGSINLAGGLTLYGYDQAGRRNRQADPLGTTSQVLDPDGRALSVTDADGKVSSNTYYPDGSVQTATDGNGNFTNYTYDGDGRILSALVYATGSNPSTTPPIRSTTYQYDADGNQQVVIEGGTNETWKQFDGAGEVVVAEQIPAGSDPANSANWLSHTASTYDADGNLLSQTDGAANQTSYGYDVDGHLVSQKVTNASTIVASWVQYVYNTAGEMVQQQNEQSSNESRLTADNYNAAGEVLQETVTDSALPGVLSQSTNSYDPDGHLLSQTDGAGNITSYVYDGAGRTSSITVTNSTGAIASYKQYGYDTEGNQTSEIDATSVSVANGVITVQAGNVTAKTFDGLGHVLSLTVYPYGNPASPTESKQWTYDGDGNVQTQTDVYGNITTDTHDGAGHLVSETVTNSAHPSVVISQKSYGYDQAGNQTSETDGTQTVTSSTYDDAGRLASRTVSNDGGPVLRTLTYTYYPNNLVNTLTEKDVSGATISVTTYQYDAAGRVTYTLVTDGSGTKVSETIDVYDWLGNKWTERHTTNASAYSETDDTYNAADQLLTHTVGQGSGYGTLTPATTNYTYDQDGRLASIKDPDGNITSYTYDAAGNKVTVTTPLGQRHYSYDDAGQLTQMVDADGRTTAYVYNAAGEMTQETWTGGAVNDTLSWAYDEDGRLLSASNGPVSAPYIYTFTYTAAGQVATVSEPFGLTLTFGYDTSGNRTSVSDSLGGSVTSSYAGSGELLNRILNNGSGAVLRVDATYDDQQLSVLNRWTDAAATQSAGKTNYAYDDGRPTSIADYNSSGSEIDYFTSAYNTQGQLTQETDSGIGTLNGVTSLYGYDASGQLTVVNSGSYQYDLNGNRTNSVTTVGTDNEITTDGIWRYTYDAEGNETQKVQIDGGDTWLYGYDNANHMVSVTQKTAAGALEMTAAYKYDAFGNRIEKDVTTYSGGTGTPTTTRFAYDGWNPAKAGATGTSNFDIWAELNGNSSLTTRYLDGDGIDQVFGRIDTGVGEFWLLTDHLGTVRTVLNGSGGVMSELSYNEFGAVQQEIGSSYTGRYTYAGRERDTETLLQYERARLYNPFTGRWMSQDPMGFDAGDSNLYRYVNNSAPNLIDPSGLQGDQLTYTNRQQPVFGKDVAKIETDKTGKRYLVVQGDGTDEKLPGYFFKVDIEKQGAGKQFIQLVEWTTIIVTTDKEKNIIITPLNAKLDTSKALPYKDNLGGPQFNPDNGPKAVFVFSYYRRTAGFGEPLDGLTQGAWRNTEVFGEGPYNTLRERVRKAIKAQPENGVQEFAYLYVNAGNYKERFGNVAVDDVMKQLQPRLNKLPDLFKAEDTKAFVNDAKAKLVETVSAFAKNAKMGFFAGNKIQHMLILFSKGIPSFFGNNSKVFLSPEIAP
jgi:RHS repeat-associated protein